MEVGPGGGRRIVAKMLLDLIQRAVGDVFLFFCRAARSLEICRSYHLSSLFAEDAKD